MKRALTVVAITVLATACSSGGGGGTSSVPAQTAPAAQVAPQAIGTGTLTIKFPTSFGHAVATAKTKLRTPKYVNPTTGDYLDVYVNAQLVLIPGSGLSYDTVAIANNATGLQTVPSIPIYSGFNDVMVAERDTNTNPASQPGDLLALGDTSTTGSPGTANGISVSMGMNLNQFAYSTDGVTANILTNGCNAIGLSNQTNTIGIFPADFSGGYTGLAGSGGVPTVTITATLNPTFSNFLTSPLGNYSLAYDSNGDGISNVNIVSSTNPAFSVYSGLNSPDLSALPAFNNPPNYTPTLNYNVQFYPTNNNGCD